MSDKTSRTLTIVQSESQVIDPHVNTDNVDKLSILSSLFETLVTRNSAGAYVPSLAESWSVSEDARLWTFDIRGTVRFHDGSLLGAHDVAESLERIRDPALGGELGSQGVFQSYLEGCRFDVAGSHTLRISCEEPFADLLDLVVLFPIVRWEGPGGAEPPFIGTGPYELARADVDDIAMKAFDGYWGGRPSITGIHWIVERSATSRARALVHGEADIVAGLTPVERGIVEDLRCRQIVAAPRSVCTVFMCNLISGICTDRRVRQALNFGLDVPELIKRVADGAASPLSGPLTRIHFGYDPAVPPYRYDSARARQLLDSAGYGSGLDVVLDVPTILPDDAPELAGLMAKQYQRVGIRAVSREFEDRPKYAEMVRAKQIDDACCFESSPLSTYRLFREKFHSGAHGPWWQGYRNPEVDKLIDGARSVADARERAGIYRRVHSILQDDAPWIFLYNSARIWGMGPKVLHWRPRVDGLIKAVDVVI